MIMSKSVDIDKRVLSEMKLFLNDQQYIGQAARPVDLLFITDGLWLKDTAVIDVLNYRKGAWDVTLVFAHYKKPLQLIVRYITRCFSEPKAKASAFYFRKEAAKDRRGTLNVSTDDMDICNN
jgi:hypothetical protein